MHPKKFSEARFHDPDLHVQMYDWSETKTYISTVFNSRFNSIVFLDKLKPIWTILATNEGVSGKENTLVTPKLERNSKKVREIELETPPCPCPSYPCLSCPCPPCPCVSAPVHQLWCISSGASTLVHQHWCIRTSALALVYQLWCISSSASSLEHQLWYIRSGASALVHQL